MWQRQRNTAMRLYARESESKRAGMKDEESMPKSDKERSKEEAVTSARRDICFVVCLNSEANAMVGRFFEGGQKKTENRESRKLIIRSAVNIG